MLCNVRCVARQASRQSYNAPYPARRVHLESRTEQSFNKHFQQEKQNRSRTRAIFLKLKISRIFCFGWGGVCVCAL
jgi:hypothetical protein